MALTQIGRATPTADIILSLTGTGSTATGSNVSYRAQFNFFSVRAIVPASDASTFADEPNSNTEPGELTYIVTFNGLLKHGTGAIAALHPPPQNVAGTWRMATGCDYVSNWNFDDVLAARPVNNNATFAGTARSKGAVTVSWVLTG